MLDLKNMGIFENGNDIEPDLEIKITGGDVMVGATDQQLYLFWGNGIGNGNNAVVTSRPHLNDGQNIPFLGYDIDFRFEVPIVGILDRVSLFN